MELLTVRDVARALKVSPRQIWKLLASGRVPEPVRLSRSVRWRRADIDEWIRLGCPDRKSFDRQAKRTSAEASA